MKTCPRCAKQVAGIHTCAATPLVGKLEREVARLTAERDALRDERDIFKRTLDKRDAERDVLRARTEKLETALRHIQNNLCLNPAKDEFYLRRTFRLYEIDAALRGEGE